jgi:hypothetical protein
MTVCRAVRFKPKKKFDVGRLVIHVYESHTLEGSCSCFVFSFLVVVCLLN